MVPDLKEQCVLEHMGIWLCCSRVMQLLHWAGALFCPHGDIQTHEDVLIHWQNGCISPKKGSQRGSSLVSLGSAKPSGEREAAKIPGSSQGVPGSLLLWGVCLKGKEVVLL